MSTARKIILFLIAICVSPAVASAASVVSTGVAGVGSAETNWTVTLLGDAMPLTAVSNECCFGGVWVNSTQPANWITPYADSNNLAANDTNANSQTAEYFYRLVFDDPNRAVTISWASDNNASFFLNSETVARSQTLFPNSYKSLVTFTIPASAFLAGLDSNTFTIDLLNVQADASPGNPTGLLVQVAPVPLPATLPLFASGLAGLGWLARRRRKHSHVA